MLAALECEAQGVNERLAQARARIAELEARASELETRNRELEAQLASAGRSESENGASVPEEGEELRHKTVQAAAEGSGMALDAEATPPEGAGSSIAQGEAPSPQALLKQWYRRYPETFFERHTRPLAVGIHETLAAREPFDEKLIRRALAGYVNLPRYLKAVRSGVARVDLDGSDAGVVGDDDARHAREQLNTLKARQEARETAQRQRRMAHKMSQLANRHE